MSAVGAGNNLSIIRAIQAALSFLTRRIDNQTFGAVSDMTEADIPAAVVAVNTEGRFSSNDGGGARWNIVATAAVTPNGFNIIQSTADPAKSFVIREGLRLNMRAWGADSAVDNGPIMQSAWDQFPWAVQEWPAGTLPIHTAVNLLNGSDETFNQGPKIVGAGIESTVFDNRVANDAMFDLDSGGTPGANFLMGAVLKGFKIIASGDETGQIGIRLKTAYMVELNRLRIDGLEIGIQVPVVQGDNDGSNMVKLRQVRIDNCPVWGVDAQGADGRNEFSFFDMDQVFIQNCGTDNPSYQPSSGGMRWKGQIIRVSNSAFTLNKNCALWIPGAPGAAQTVDLQSTTFENNEKRNIFCRGVSQFKARNIQQYHNDAFNGTTGIEFEGSSHVVRSVDIDGAVVRATAANDDFTAFKLVGAHVDPDSCRVKNVVWDNFDYDGQTRFEGWQFDHIENDCVLVVPDAATVSLKPKAHTGNKVPLCLGNNGAEWIAHEVPAAGISTGNSGLSPDTRYYCYLKHESGVTAIELSTAGFVADTQTGYPVKSGDASRYYVGSVETDGDGAFKTSATGWLNPTVTYDGPQSGVPVYVWSDSTTTRRVKYAVPPTSNGDGVPV